MKGRIAPLQGGGFGTPVPIPTRKAREPRVPGGLLLLLGLVAAGGTGGWYYVQSHPEVTALAPSFEPLEYLLQVPDRVKAAWDEIVAQAARLSPASPGTVSDGVKSAKRTATRPATSSKNAQSVLPDPSRSQPQVTLYLTNGGSVTGALIRETPEDIVLQWDYGEAGFLRKEIVRMERDTAQPTPGDEPQEEANNDVVLPWEGTAGQWTYEQDVVVKLLTGSVIDRTISAVTPEAIVLTQTLPGGGRVEQTIPRADIEELLFKPIKNERSRAIEETLKTIFPHMRFYEEGMFTIVSDSIPPTVKGYRRAVRELATDWYLAFHPLLTTRAPQVQQHVVVFDDWDSYIEYARTDGVPGWIAVGYFHPEDQVLYCFNMLGERFSELLSDAYLGQFRGARDRFSQEIKGSRYEEFIEGQISEFLQKLESAHATVRQIYGQVSTETLRHELTHALFSNWRLQGVILSQMSGQDQTEIQKKRDYLKTGDAEQKRRLLEELLRRERAAPAPEIQAANSWYVEGLAGFMEPSPVGQPLLTRLADAQEARRQGRILPLEFLHTFRMGSFAGMSTQSMLDAYAQSWALCHFLMHRYPGPFLAYLDRLVREQPTGEQETLPWLLEAVGKEQRVLEQEFLAHLDAFPPEDSWALKEMQFFLDLRAELTALANRLWNH